MSERRRRLVLILVVAATSLPFVFQPFHIDDRIYWEVAGNALRNPLHPYDYVPLFEGLTAEDAASHSHLPLISYYVAVIRRVTASRQEWPYHLAFMIFPLLAAFGFYDLGRRYLKFPLAVTILLLVTPGVFVLSHTLMTEVPMLAFWLLAISRFLRITDGPSTRGDWIICTLSLLGAALISLLSLGLILLLAAWLFLKYLGVEAAGPAGVGDSLVSGPDFGPDGPGAASGADAGLEKEPAVQNGSGARTPWLWLLGVLMLPLLLWLIWYLLSYLHYERFVLIRTFLHLDKRAAFSWTLTGEKALSFILNLGAVFLFPVIAWAGFGRRKSTLGALVVFPLSFAVGYFGYEWRGIHSLLFALFLSTGVLALAGMAGVLASGLGRGRGGDAKAQLPTLPAPRDALLLLFWGGGILAAYVLLYTSGSVRYSLLATPVVIILFGLALQRQTQNEYFLRNLVWAAVVLTGAYSLLLGHADYRFARMYRDSVEELAADYERLGRTVWFTGEWGFRYYMEQAGALPLPRVSAEPLAGDIIIKPYVASPWVTLYDSDALVGLLEQRPAGLGSPIRMLDFSSHAGFYSTAWGILPFSIGTEERWEWFNVFEVKKRYDGPIPEPEQHW